VVAELGLRVDALTIKSREDGGGADAVKAAIVKTNQNAHSATPWFKLAQPWGRHKARW
jgi:hypothetical protein